MESEAEGMPVAAPAKPKIEAVHTDAEYGKFVAEPLPRGLGHTLGNALRRVLLGSLPGAAITAVQIDGVQHEYSSIPHVREDVVDLLLNIKAVRLRAHTQRSGTLRCVVQGPGQVTAGDIQPSADFEVVNPEVYLAHLDSPEAKLSLTLHASVGTGYQLAASAEGMPIGYLPLDAIFTPTRKVNYTVEKTRVGQVTDYERLTLEVWTDGSKSPIEALREAAQILMGSFSLFASVGVEAAEQVDGQGIIGTIPPEHYHMPIERLDLSARTLNCLKRNKINKVGEVLTKSDEELLRIKNFGEKSLQELKERLRALGIIPAELGAPTGPEGAPAAATEPKPTAPAAAGAVAEAGVAGAEPEAKRDKTARAKETLKDLAALRALLGGELGEQAGGEGGESASKSGEGGGSQG